MNAFSKCFTTVALGAALTVLPCVQAEITYGERHQQRSRLNSGDATNRGAEHSRQRHHRDDRNQRLSDRDNHTDRAQAGTRRPGFSARTHPPREHTHEQFRDGYRNGYRDALRERDNRGWHPSTPYLQPGYVQPYQLPAPGYGLPPAGYGQHLFPYAEPEYRGFNFPQEGFHSPSPHQHRQLQQRLR